MNATITLALAVLAPGADGTDSFQQTRQRAQQTQNRQRSQQTQTVQSKDLSQFFLPTVKANTFFNARVAMTPDINQHMTYKEWLKQLPPALHAKYTPPAEIGINSRLYHANFCGPTAVADNLIFLRNWFPQIHSEPDPIAAGALLARNLGHNYLGTMSEPEPEDLEPADGKGTSYIGMVKGTLQYLKEKGINVKKATVIGYRAHADEREKYGHNGTAIQLVQRAPTVAEIKQALHMRAVVVMHYGHYDYMADPKRLGSNQKSNPYLQRSGGHYITPLGYGLDKNGKFSNDTISAYDPAGGYQDVQREIFIDWMRQPKGAHQNLPLLNRRGDDPIRHKSLANPAWPKYEYYGAVSGTYTMDTVISKPKHEQRYEVLEGLIVIEV